MKPIYQNLTLTTGGKTAIELDLGHSGSFIVLQTLFTGATAPTYNIECNYGMLDSTPIQGSPNGLGPLIVDPNGWQPLPSVNGVTISATGLTANATLAITAPILFVRVNITTAGVGTGVFKVIQQGIAR